MSNNPLNKTPRASQGKLPYATMMHYVLGTLPLPDPGELVIMAGDPGTGKTFLSASMLYAAKEKGQVVAHFDLEDGAQYVYKRLGDNADLNGIMYLSMPDRPTVEAVISFIKKSQANLIVLDGFTVLNSSVSPSQTKKMSPLLQNLQSISQAQREMDPKPAIIITLNHLTYPKTCDYYASRVWHLHKIGEKTDLRQRKDKVHGMAKTTWQFRLDKDTPALLKEVK